jgi:hypothetical protein
MIQTPIRNRGWLRRTIYLRLALVVPVLIAAFVLHVSGETLVIMRVARIAIVAAFVAGGWWLRRRRQDAKPTQAP